MIRNCATCGYNGTKAVCNDCFFFSKWISKMDYAEHVATTYEKTWEGNKTMNEMVEKMIKNSVYGANAQYKELLKRNTPSIKPLSQTRVPRIKNVIFNEPATIVFWNDGTKTVVKADGDIYDPEKGLAMAISKKALGNQGNYYEVFKDWLPEDIFDDKDMDPIYPNFVNVGKAAEDAAASLTRFIDSIIDKKKEEKNND